MFDPYVPTNRGFRRKIGPKSKYGLNASPQNGADGTLYGNHPGSRFTGQTKVGMMTGARRESNFQTSMRESRELSEANAAMEAKEKERTAKAKAAEIERKQTQGSFTGGIGDMLKKARESGKRPGRTPYRSGMK